jgi:hypothetical protein
MHKHPNDDHAQSTAHSNGGAAALTDADLAAVAGGGAYSNAKNWRRQHITRRWNWVKGFFGS